MPTNPDIFQLWLAANCGVLVDYGLFQEVE